MAESERTLAKNTFFLYVMQISGYVFPLLTFPYLTRVLGAEKYGVVVFANAVMQYFSMLIEFGFILSATKTCSECRGDQSALGVVTFSVIGAKLILALLGAAVLAVCCVFNRNFRENSSFFTLSYIGIILSAFLPDFLFHGIEQMSVLTYRVIVSKAVYTAFIFGLVRRSADYMLVPVATIGSNLVAVGMTWIEIKRRNLIGRPKISIRDIFSHLKESAVFFLSRIAVSLYSTLNTVLLGVRFSEAALGQYGVANSLTNTCRSMLSPVSDSIYPYLVNRKNFALVRRILLILEPMIVAGCVLLWFIAAPVIRIVCGEGYSGAVPVFRAMLPLIVISLPTYLFGYPVLGALNRVGVANTSVIAGSAFHVAGLLVLHFCGRLDFISVPLLTFATEIVVFAIRAGTVAREYSARKGHRSSERKGDDA